MNLVSAARSQSTKNTARIASRPAQISRRPSGPARSLVQSFLELRPYVRVELVVGWVLLQRLDGAWPAELDRNVGNDAARAGAHDHNAVRHRYRLGEVVRDEDDRASLALPQAEEHILQLQLRLRIERAKRFVHQQDGGVETKGARQGDALAHALRECLGVGVLEAFEADLIEEVEGATAPFRRCHTPDLGAELGIAHRRPPRAERVSGKHVGDIAVSNERLLATDEELASPHILRQQSRREVEQCGLAAAAGSDDRDEFARRDVQRHVVDGKHSRELDGDMLENDRARGW